LLLAQLGTEFSYRQVQKILAPYCRTPPSHATIQKRVTALGKARDTEEKEARRQLEKEGVLPQHPGQKVAARLFLEADGVFISFRRTKQRKAEIKLAYAYQGKELIGEGRYSLIDKTAFAGLHQTSDFWNGFLLELDGQYNLARTEQYVLGADGAEWAKAGMEYLAPVVFQLDRYHLQKAIARATLFPTWTPLFQQATAGDLAGVLGTLADLQGKTQTAHPRHSGRKHRQDPGPSLQAQRDELEQRRSSLSGQDPGAPVQWRVGRLDEEKAIQKDPSAGKPAEGAGTYA
jgi:hypothetical protein